MQKDQKAMVFLPHFIRKDSMLAEFNFCVVPLSGRDAFLFVSLALLLAAVLFGKLSAVWVLVAGEPCISLLDMV
jgi:hypothetical protein